MRKMYILTDGTQVYDTRIMSDDEAQEANELARLATDGNVFWQSEQQDAQE